MIPKKGIPSPIDMYSQGVKRDALYFKIANDLIEVHQKFLSKIDEAADIINHRVGPQGPKGDRGNPGRTYTREEVVQMLLPYIPKVTNGHTPTEEELISLITPLIPEVNVEEIAQLAKSMVMKSLPETQIVFEEMLKVKKFEIKDINGLEQWLKALSHQNGSKGYLHGGGVPSLSAGSNITLTPKNDGGFTISASGGGSSTWSTPPEAVDARGGVTVFTVGSSAPNDVVADGVYYFNGLGYTFAAGQITFNIGGAGPTQFVRYR